MTPEAIIADLDRELAEYRQTVTLQRTSVDADGAVTVTASADCPAKVRPYTPQDLEAGEVQDIWVILSPTSLVTFGMPGRDTRIIIEDDDPSNIEQLEPLYWGGKLVRLNLLCRDSRMLVLRVLFWVLLILSFIFTWTPWSQQAPPWSNHIVVLILIALLGLMCLEGGGAGLLR